MASLSPNGHGEVPLSNVATDNSPTSPGYMSASNPDYSYEARLIQGPQEDGVSPSPISSKRSMLWPFHSSISTHTSPIDPSEQQTPIYTRQPSILRRYASTRSANLLHRRTPSSASRSLGGNSWGASKGLRHGANPSISTIRTVASSSTLFPVPDYVANYIRGETPESIAERREERARRGMQRFPQIREGSMDLEEGVEGQVVGDLHPGMGSKEMGGGNGEDSKWRRRCMPGGWRATMSLTLLLAVLLLITAAVMTAHTAIKHSDTFWTAESAIFTSSSCKAVRVANQGAHAAAAVLGMLLVAGAGHAAQVLGAPTRNNVNKAHSDGRKLDVGRGLSVRNLKTVNMGRVIISLVALVSATGTLVAFNGLVFNVSTTSGDDDLDESEATECSLTLDGALLGVILIFLVITAGTLIVALARPTFNPLLTLGDAISSFASRPDASFRHSIGSVVVDPTGRDTPSGQALVGGAELRQTRWMSTVSVGRWTTWSATWAIPFTLTLAALVLSLTDSDKKLRLALGEPLWTVETPLGNSRSALVILASLPQILVALLYLSTSALLTAFFSARELGGYDAAAKAAAAEGGVVRLRVSGGGVGTQTTSMYATLPPIVSIILWVAFSAIGFLVSQSLTVVAVDMKDGQEVTGVGLTPLALIVLLALLTALGVAVLSMSFFCRSTVPRGAQGTLAIALLCRVWGASREEEEMREQPQTQYTEPSPAGWRGEEERPVSWGAQSEAQRTLASGKWMSAGRVY
ncbi:hypothetical protein LIA77_04128 [Sarocladium implicatum]|nr:hypothetical protein LIA77_04128 [Sarocladium implicatum]